MIADFKPINIIKKLILLLFIPFVCLGQDKFTGLGACVYPTKSLNLKLSKLKGKSCGYRGTKIFGINQ